MKKPVFLNQYLYSIPASSFMLSAIAKKRSGTYEKQPPLLKVVLDFENGSLRLEGDWAFIMDTNKLSSAPKYTQHRKRVFIDAAIYPALAINLNDPASDGMIFQLEGGIKDEKSFSSCSGLLIIEKIYNGYSQQWNISFYLSDLQISANELKFKLPVYVGRNKTCYN